MIISKAVSSCGTLSIVIDVHSNKKIPNKDSKIDYIIDSDSKLADKKKNVNSFYNDC